MIDKIQHLILKFFEFLDSINLGFYFLISLAAIIYSCFTLHSVFFRKNFREKTTVQKLVLISALTISLIFISHIILAGDSLLKDLESLVTWCDTHQGFFTFLAVLVALFLGLRENIIKLLYKPNLKLYFEDGKEPYCHKISFEEFETEMEFFDHKFYFQRPGFNSRIKIANEGKTTAKNVQVYVERVELYDLQNNLIEPAIHYHPTKIKWSGEMNWSPVNIISESYFLLDVFWCRNETLEEIVEFNYYVTCKEEIEKDIITEFLTDAYYSNNVFWNIWVESPDRRGIPQIFQHEGVIDIFFIINAQNTPVLKFKANIKWSETNWDRPEIKFYIFGKNSYNKLVQGGK